MPGDIQDIVGSAVSGLGYELVEVERSARGLLRVYIDKAGGIAVDDCATVSNHLSRVFAVEGVDFERLEVSSPGLDRPLRRIEDFQRFVGRGAKVRLHEKFENRRRFDGVIESARAGVIAFRLIEEPDTSTASHRAVAKGARRGVASVKGKPVADATPEKLITVPLENIERARLIPEY